MADDLLLRLLADGFFDAGMLLQALKANSKTKEDAVENVLGHSRKMVGKKLRLSEY